MAQTRKGNFFELWSKEGMTLTQEKISRQLSPNSKMTPTQRKNSSEFPSLRQKRRGDGDWKEIFFRVDIQTRFNVDLKEIIH